jgi:hypothetical protein
VNGSLAQQIGAQIRAMSIPVRAAILFGVCTVAALVAGFAAQSENDPARVYAVAIAAVICTCSALVALVLSLAWHGTPNGVAGALGGTLVGLGIPLVAAIFVQRRDGDLAHAGFYGWIVVFYLIALTVKTLLVAPGYAAGGYSPSNPYGPSNSYGPGKSYGPGNPPPASTGGSAGSAWNTGDDVNVSAGPSSFAPPSDDPNSPAKKSGE